MSKQKHDLGNKKQATSTTPETKARSTDHLAADLVRRGLASKLILDRGQVIPEHSRRGR